MGMSSLVRIPRVHISADEEGGKEIELSDDPYDCVRLDVENVPCIVTLCKVGSWYQTFSPRQVQKSGRSALAHLQTVP